MDSLQIPNSSMMEGQSLEAESPHAAAAEIPQQRMMTMSPQQQQPGADFQQHEGVGAGSSLPHLDAGSVFLSVVVEDDSNLSFCAYNEDENTIYVETAHVTGFEVEEMVQQVLGTVRPTLMLLPNKTVCDHKLLALLTTAQDAAFLEADDGDVDENDGDQVSGGEESVAHPDLPPRQRNRVNNGRPRSIPYRITKTASLDARACKSAIMRLRLRSLERKRGDSAGPHHAGNHRGFNQPRHFPLAPTAASSARAAEVSHYHALASVIDFDSKTQVQAIGSLLAFLQTTVFQHVPGGLIPVNDVVQLQTSQFMKIHRDTLSSLNIFATEHHPLASAKGHGGGSKEGCSLFSLLDRTRTHAGRMRLREWMMKPLLSIPDIRTRQDGVELFLRPEFQSATHKLAELMRRVGGVTRILSRLHKAVAHPKDFIALPKAIAYALSVCEVLEQDFRFPLRQCMQSQHRRLAARDVDAQEHSARRHVTQDDPMTPSDDAVQQVDDEKCAEAYLDFLGHILDRCHVNVMEQVVGHMTTIVDEDATLASDSVVVVRGFSAELDEYKDTYDKLGGIMLVFEKDLLVRVPWLRDSVKVIFFPQVGFLAAIRNTASWADDFTLPDDFEIMFTEMSIYYFKCLEVHELDSEFGDLNAAVRDLETVIRSALEDDILESDADLRETFSALADLDCILSFADVAAELGYVRPTVLPAEEKCIQIQKGAHPLQELLIEDGKQFVRNDVSIDVANRLNIVTGPNFSGKSCYARQVGILTYMAHLGSFLPCESAAISVVDRLLSQFSIVETCGVPQSSFQLDLTRMGTVLRSATAYSLVVIDEFGKGTNPASGIGLLAAALQKLSQVGSLVLCTTHFLELFSMNLLRDSSAGVRALNMEVQIPESDRETAAPLFKLRHGVAQSSAGLACAKLSGVKDSVLKRAREIMATTKDGRRIEPLTEVLRNTVTDGEREAVAAFLTTDWENADDEILNEIRERILSL